MRNYSQILKIWKWIAFILLATVIIIGSVSCLKNNNSQESITVGAPALEQNALLYVADSQGFFNNNGLKVTIKDYQLGVETINALSKGEVDIAETAEFPFVNLALQKQPNKIIAVNDRFENDYLLGRKDKGIKEISDLKGKRIGVIQGTVLEFYLGRFLEIHGIKLNDVTIVNTKTPVQTTDAIIKGEVDAVAIVTPRIKPFIVGDMTIHEIGIPWHYGWVTTAMRQYVTGDKKPEVFTSGDSANILTPFIGDSNTMIPESKAFMANIEKKGV